VDVKRESISRFNACKTLAGSCRIEALKGKEGEVLNFVLYVDGQVIDHIEELGPVSHGRTLLITGNHNNQMLAFVYSIIKASI
jgi:hypothetical protein